MGQNHYYTHVSVLCTLIPECYEHLKIEYEHHTKRYTYKGKCFIPYLVCKCTLNFFYSVCMHPNHTELDLEIFSELENPTWYHFLTMKLIKLTS